MKNLQKIKGDASSRKFYRKWKKKSSSIVILSEEEKIKNLLHYEAINRILIKNKILAPTLYKECYNENYLEIQDFGDKTIYKILSKNSNKISYFKKIIKLLLQIQSIKTRSIKDFKKKTFTVPKYERKILLKEANLFCEWYIKKNLSKKNRKKFKKKFELIVYKLSSNLKLKDNIFVHRDFHVSNLMMYKNRIGVIDSQDALIGNQAYDVASLIDDVRLKTKNSLKNEIYNFYLSNNKTIDKDKFKNDFEILSILRNLKIIGIFTRLAIRDNKRQYLKLIPYAWELINSRIHTNEIFKDLKELLSKNFKGRIK